MFCDLRYVQGVENLFDRQDRMASYGPTFCDITWGAGGTTADLTLDIAAKMQNMVRLPPVLLLRKAKFSWLLCCRSLSLPLSLSLSLSHTHTHTHTHIRAGLQVCVETMMHLTCTNMPESQLENALDKVRSSIADDDASLHSQMTMHGAATLVVS